MNAAGTRKNPIVLLHTNNAELVAPVIRAIHPDLHLFTCDSYCELPQILSETSPDVVYSLRFDGTPDFPRSALLESTSVRWIAVGGSGTDHLAPWDPEKISVSNAAGVSADMMAQYVVGLIYHFSLNLPQFLERKRKRMWINGEVEPVTDKTVLIVGLGATGRAVAQLCKAQGMNTLGTRACPVETPFVDEVHASEQLPNLLPRADVLVICVPLLDCTRHLIDHCAFQALKDRALLIDVSRGGVVDEKALLSALDDGTLQGAGLDVFEQEPLPESHPLWQYDNVVITPHCSSVYQGWEQKSAELFAANLQNYRADRPLFNVVDPQRGY